MIGLYACQNGAWIVVDQVKGSSEEWAKQGYLVGPCAPLGTYL